MSLGQGVHGWRVTGQLWAAAAVLLAVLGCFTTGPARSPSSALEGNAPYETALYRAREQARVGAYGLVVDGLTDALGAAADPWPSAAEYEAQELLGEAHLWLGRQREAFASFQRDLELARQLGDQGLEARARGGMGNSQLAVGKTDAALALLKEAEAKARTAGADAVLAGVLNNLGNALVASGDSLHATESYRESAELAEATGNPLLAASALANRARLALDGGDVDAALPLLEDAHRLAGRAVDSQVKAHVLVTIGVAYVRLAESSSGEAAARLADGREVLGEAIRVAEALPDARTLSYAWGELGNLYRHAGYDEEALQLTRRALLEAQRADAPESLYRWEWQLARLLWEDGEEEAALAAYGRAVYAVQHTRQESASCYSDAGSNFRDLAAPLYQEWVDLLLRRSATVKDGAEPLVRQAREGVEVLQVFELQDYFQDDCVAAGAYRQVSVDDVSKSTAILYVISLPARTELLVSLPSGMRSVAVPVAAETLAAEVLSFRQALENRTTWGFLPHARQLYDWIIRPVERQLLDEHIETLVFVPTGPLRGVPLAALHDGTRFLVERFATGMIPGLNLTDPHPLDAQRLKVLSLGITEAVQGFPGLPHVAEEFRAIEDVFEGTALLDREFQAQRARQALADPSFGIVHVASHGQFRGSAEDSFLLAYDGRITLEDLGSSTNQLEYREQPLELLTLSACETAAGDERAALGLAGVAVKAGARSAVATLWTVNDVAASHLVAAFYRELGRNGASRAAALRSAQLQLLAAPRYDHPAYWAPFVLINNWL